MDEYTRLKTKLETYLEKPDIELSENEISMYDLHQIVDYKLTELRSIQINPQFQDEINKDLTSSKKIRKLFHKKTPNFEKNVPVLCLLVMVKKPK